MDKTYLATDADIRKLTEGYVAAITTGEETRSTYLRILVRHIQKELGAEPRTNNVRSPKLTQEQMATQLAAAAAVHERFYTLVNEVVDSSITNVPSKDRAQEKNRRTNFARTAIYAVRLYIRSGKDVTALAPARASKSAIAISVAPKTPSPRRLKGRVERASKAFMVAVLALSEADQQAAVSELDTLLGQLATQLASLGVAAVRNPTKAAHDHVPLRVGSTTFIPTSTAILRQRERPT